MLQRSDSTNIGLTNIGLTNIRLTNIRLTNIGLTNIRLTNIGLTNIGLKTSDLQTLDVQTSDLQTLDLKHRTYKHWTYKHQTYKHRTYKRQTGTNVKQGQPSDQDNFGLVQTTDQFNVYTGLTLVLSYICTSPTFVLVRHLCPRFVRLRFVPSDVCTGTDNLLLKTGTTLF